MRRGKGDAFLLHFVHDLLRRAAGRLLVAALAATRVWLLVAASFYFYATWNKWLAIILCISTLVDYLLALAIERSTGIRRRKLLLCVSLLANLGLLCYFKYANFFLLSLDEVLIAAGYSNMVSQSSGNCARSASPSTPLKPSITWWTCIAAVSRPSATWATFYCSSCSSRIWWPARSCRARDFLPQIKRPKQLRLGAPAPGPAILLDGAVQETGHRRPHGPIRGSRLRSRFELSIADRMDRHVRLRPAGVL